MKENEYTILIIDDDKLTREMYTERVEQEPEFTVLTAEDGLAGLEILRSQKVDLVFTGIVMPRMDGFELVESMRADANLKSIPIMVSSHWGRHEDKEKATEMQIPHFIVRGDTTLNQVVNIMKMLLVTEKSKYALRIAPNSPDYENFVQTMMGLPCQECDHHEQLPVTVTLESAGSPNLFSIIKDCERCHNK